jgi:hypothetical protein
MQLPCVFNAHLQLLTYHGADKKHITRAEAFDAPV